MKTFLKDVKYASLYENVKEYLLIYYSFALQFNPIWLEICHAFNSFTILISLFKGKLNKKDSFIFFSTQLVINSWYFLLKYYEDDLVVRESCSGQIKVQRDLHRRRFHLLFEQLPFSNLKRVTSFIITSPFFSLSLSLASFLCSCYWWVNRDFSDEILSKNNNINLLNQSYLTILNAFRYQISLIKNQE